MVGGTERPDPPLRDVLEARSLPQLALADVPPVILAEAHADYAAVAAKAAVRGID